MIKRLLLIIMAFLLPMSLAHAEEAFYGVDYGITKYQFDNDELDELGPDVDVDDKDTGYVLVLGSRSTNGIGVELNYANLGTYTLDASFIVSGTPVRASASADITSFGFAASYKWDVAEAMAIIPRLGYHQWNSDGEITATNISTGASAVVDDDFSDDGLDIFYGVGFQVAFTENVAGVVNITRYDVDDDLDLMSLGIRYSFN